MAEQKDAESFGRKLPFSLEAEQSVLGSILIDPEKFTSVATLISSDDFYVQAHASIFEAMQELFLKDRTIDVVTLIDTLVKLGVYTDEESKNYVKVLAEAVPTAANILDYAKIVRDKSTLRKLITACSEITDTAFEGADEVSNIVDSAEQKIFEIAQGQIQKDFTHIREVIISVYDHLRLLQTDREAAIGTPTGFTELDKILVGMAPTDLILIGARPGMGKTSFAMNIATKAAIRTKKAVCIFSLEMSKEQLVTRLLSSEAMVDSYALRSGTLKDKEWSDIANAASQLSECDMLIDDTTGITVTGMKAKLRRVKNIGLVIIDYLQLMQGDHHIDNRVQEVSEISRNLKLLAKDLQVPVICCAQLSRAPESRNDRTPQLSDLRDSGAIEQDADVVLFLYRPDYYKEGEEDQNYAEVIIAKNRHGATGKIKMGWMGQYTKFTDIAQEEAPGGGGGSGGGK
jgi:replicative DNA helicase